MAVRQIFDTVSKAGLVLSPTDSGNIKVTPKALITPAVRELVKANKTALMAALETASEQLAVSKADTNLERQLLEAAMRACDYWGDSDQARAEMVAEIQATSQHLRQDLLEHFLCAYGKSK
jgi:Tfp pilus assembly pilus retraction ATPase PilT